MDGFEETVVSACEDAEAGETEEANANAKERNARIKAEITKHGWPASPYAVSKAGLTAVSMILGREELRLSSSASVTSRARRSSPPSSTLSSPKSLDRGLPVLVNAVCPGYVKTDLTLQKGRKTVEQGAELPVRLALEDIDGVGGEFWERGGVGVWDDGGEVGETDG